MKRTFAIGDIHGCLDKLKALMDKLPITNEDELVFIGDYIDRGPESSGVIDYLLKMKHRNTIFLAGNHEDMMERAIAKKPAWGDLDLWFQNGGWATIKSYSGHATAINEQLGFDAVFPEAHLDFIKKLYLYHTTNKYIFVHAGANPTIPMENHDINYLLWAREEFIKDETPWQKTVIFGHTPQDKPLVMNNKIGIDTGCVFGGKLTCIELPNVKFYQA